MITTVLLVSALVCFLLALLELPQVSSNRCIALGLALVVLAQLLGASAR
jgi:hypothetical protein